MGVLVAQSLSVSFDSVRVELPDGDESYSARLFVVFSRSNEEEPRLAIGDDVVPRDATPFYALDVNDRDGGVIDFLPSAGYPCLAFPRVGFSPTGRGVISFHYPASRLQVHERGWH